MNIGEFVWCNELGPQQFSFSQVGDGWPSEIPHNRMNHDFLCEHFCVLDGHMKISILSFLQFPYSTSRRTSGQARQRQRLMLRVRSQGTVGLEAGDAIASRRFGWDSAQSLHNGCQKMQKTQEQEPVKLHIYKNPCVLYIFAYFSVFIFRIFLISSTDC